MSWISVCARSNGITCTSNPAQQVYALVAHGDERVVAGVWNL